MNNSITRTDRLPSIKNKDVTVLTPNDVDSLEKTPNLISSVSSQQMNKILMDLGIDKNLDNIAIITAEEVIAAQPKDSNKSEISPNNKVKTIKMR